MDSADEAAVLRAALNDELGYYPAEADGESVDEHRLKAARDAEHLERYRRKYGSPRASHWNQFRHVTRNRGPRL